jgi:hypothetical protein
MPRRGTLEELLADATSPFSEEAFEWEEDSTPGLGAFQARIALALLLCLRTEQGKIVRPLEPSSLFRELGKLAQDSHARWGQWPNGTVTEVPLGESLALLPEPPAWLNNSGFLQLFRDLKDALKPSRHDLSQKISRTVYELAQGGSSSTDNENRGYLTCISSEATHHRHLDLPMAGSVGQVTIIQNALIELQRASEAAGLVHPFYQAKVLEKVSKEFAERMKAYRMALQRHYMGTAQGSKEYSTRTHSARVRCLYLHDFEGLSWPKVTEMLYPGKPNKKGWVTKRADEARAILTSAFGHGYSYPTPPYFPLSYIRHIFELTRLDFREGSIQQDFEALLESHQGL